MLAWETLARRDEEARRCDDTPIGSRGDGRPITVAAGDGRDDSLLVDRHFAGQS